MSLCDSREGQLSIRAGFLKLFEECFGRSMDQAAWEHYYLNAPPGITRSFVFFEGDALVAHGGLIPQQLEDASGKRIDFFLQTAVMVHKKYQSLALFKSLLDWMDAYVKDQRAFSLCFPNQASFQPFVKLLRWKLVREYAIHQFRISDQPEPDGRRESSWGSFGLDLPRDPEFLNWRGEVNRMKIIEIPECLLTCKEYEGNIDLLDIRFKGDWTLLPLRDIIRKLGFSRVNVPGCYLDVCSLSGLQACGTVGIPQRMCLFPAEHPGCRYEEIKPSLLLSDVF